MPADLAPAIVEAARVEAEAEAIRAAAEAARNAKDLAATLAALPAWRAGQNPDDFNAYSLPGAVLRIAGVEVETSMGARVPTEHAARAYRVLAKLRDRGETYQRNGHTEHVGHYTIESLNADGVVSIGCHKIAWEEVATLAKLAGW